VSPLGYVTAPRLDALGQRYQGDIVLQAPCILPLPDGGVSHAVGPAILLTPTCDFAMKTGGEMRLLFAIEAFTPGSALRQQFAQNVVPQHAVPLPPLEAFWPLGGAVLLRRPSPMRAALFATLRRVATLNEPGLRALLVGHTRYYLRTVIDGLQVPVPLDDPRPLWSAIDDAGMERRFIARRDAVNHAMEVAIGALAQHHGVTAVSTALSLYRLQAVAARSAISVAACDAVQMLLAAEQTLKAIYQQPPRDPNRVEQTLRGILDDLEQVGMVLQERDPRQFSEQQYRALVQEQPLAEPNPR
jgi:hypothetical protein